MNFLFIHQNFPGQFPHIAQHLARMPEHKVISISQPQAKGLAGVTNIQYKPARGITKGVHHYIAGLELAVLNAQTVAKVMETLKQKGFTPDVVVGHAGWGETLYVKDVFPRAKLINYFEFYYHANGADTDFDPEFPNSADDVLRIRTKNSVNLLSLDSCDAGISPTHWQKSLYPAEFQPKISVIHEGINTALVKPDASVRFTLPNGKVLTKQDKVITYVSRNLEPYRGFHVMMRAIPAIQKAHPDAEILITGGDDISYGRKTKDGKTYREQMLTEVSHINLEKVHFLGNLPYDKFLKMLQVSSAHIYLTVPFVLSWSMLEAMACGCHVIASDTAPVREVIEHNKNGILVNFFSTEEIVDAINKVLADKKLADKLSKAAVQHVHKCYTVGQGIEAYMKILAS